MVSIWRRFLDHLHSKTIHGCGLWVCVFAYVNHFNSTYGLRWSVSLACLQCWWLLMGKMSAFVVCFVSFLVSFFRRNLRTFSAYLCIFFLSSVFESSIFRRRKMFNAKLHPSCRIYARCVIDFDTTFIAAGKEMSEVMFPSDFQR